MTLRTVATFAVGLFLMTGCAPKARLNVPDGWKVAVAKDDPESGTIQRIIVNEKEQVKISVIMAPAKDFPLEETAAATAIDLAMKGVAVKIDKIDDQGTTLITFTADIPDVGQLTGRMLLKKSSKGDKTVGVIGLWPAAKDAVIGPAFEAIAASADFK